MNIGNPEEFTVIELANIIIELTRSRSKIRFEPLPPDDPKQRRPDISLAERVLGWRPEVSLQVGLRRTAGYFASVTK